MWESKIYDKIWNEIQFICKFMFSVTNQSSIIIHKKIISERYRVNIGSIELLIKVRTFVNQ